MSAYLTVYMALSLGVMITLSLALIEGLRLNTAQLEMVLASDIATDAVMAEYHRELFKRFNILAIDSSYGGTSVGKESVRGRLEYYVSQNLSGVMTKKAGGMYVYKDLTGVCLQNVSLTDITVLTDGNGSVFRRKAVEALNDDLGITGMENVMKWLETVEKYQLDTRDVEEEKRKLEEEIALYQEKEGIVSEEELATLDSDEPTVSEKERKKTGIIKKILGDKELSGKILNQSILVAQRIKDGRALQGILPSDEQGEAETLVQRIAFVEFLMRYMGCYLNKAEGSALDYELEYVIAGKDADADNLKGVLFRLLALREAANATYLFADKEKSGEAEVVALAASIVLLVPELKDVFQAAVLLGWAYAESVYDLKALLDGGRIPLIKDKKTWHYSLSNILEDAWEDFVNGQQVVKDQDGLNYQDYLRILMLVMKDEEMTLRSMNLVEADIRQTQGNKAFRLDGCISGFRSQIVVESGRGYHLEYTEAKHY